MDPGIPLFPAFMPHGFRQISSGRFFSSGLQFVSSVVLFSISAPGLWEMTKIDKEATGMTYTAQDYTKLIGMPGFGETLLKNHFTLYQGYVTNTNKVLETVELMLKEGKTALPEFAELKRRLGWEFNGMRLHELYFANLGGKNPFNQGGKLARRLAESFGSVEAWEKEFRAVGAMRGIGWAVLYEDNTNGRLINFWVNEHDTAHPAGCNPILIMDVFEHAYMIDFGLKRADYIEAFFKNIDWNTAEERLK
jgi:Fe-Mn family superoxide dismutase